MSRSPPLLSISHANKVSLSFFPWQAVSLPLHLPSPFDHNDSQTKRLEAFWPTRRCGLPNGRVNKQLSPSHLDLHTHTPFEDAKLQRRLAVLTALATSEVSSSRWTMDVNTTYTVQYTLKYVWGVRLKTTIK